MGLYDQDGHGEGEVHPGRITHPINQPPRVSFQSFVPHAG